MNVSNFPWKTFTEDNFDRLEFNQLVAERLPYVAIKGSHTVEFTTEELISFLSGEIFSYHNQVMRHLLESIHIEIIWKHET